MMGRHEDATLSFSRPWSQKNDDFPTSIPAMALALGATLISGTSYTNMLVTILHSA